MSRENRLHAKKGQAMVELAIALITIIILISGTTTLARIALTQIRTRRDIRAEAGFAGIRRATHGNVLPGNQPEDDIVQMRTIATRINDYNRLNTYSPELRSLLPASNYTLQARALPTGELGLRTSQKSAIIPLDKIYTSFIYKPAVTAEDEYGNSAIRITETLVYPATDGLWPKADTR